MKPPKKLIKCTICPNMVNTRKTSIVCSPTCRKIRAIRNNNKDNVKRIRRKQIYLLLTKSSYMSRFLNSCKKHL